MVQGLGFAPCLRRQEHLGKLVRVSGVVTRRTGVFPPEALKPALDAGFRVC